MSIADDLVALRSTYPPRLSPHQAVELLNRFALQHQALGFGLYQAPAGGNGWELSNGVRVRCDILATRDPEALKIYDVFRDGPDSTRDPIYHGEAAIVWQDKGPIDLSRWVAPVPLADPVPPPPPPVVDETLVTLKRLEEKIDKALILAAGIHKRQNRKAKTRIDLGFLGSRSATFEWEPEA